MLRRTNPPASVSDRREEKETGRLEAFSDGVFSVAMTLLVVDLAVPTVADVNSGLSVGAALAKDGPAFVAYILSFVTILVMWINHHSVFSFVYRIDRAFIFYNGLLLMDVVFINFPTALVATYMSAERAKLADQNALTAYLTAGATPNGKLAAGVLAGAFLLVAILFALLWHRAADGRRLIGARMSQRAIDTLTAQYRFGPLLYLVTLGLAFVNGWASLFLNAALAVYFAFTGQIIAPEEPDAATEASATTNEPRDHHA